jgi:hypothetical protein
MRLFRRFGARRIGGATDGEGIGGASVKPETLDGVMSRRRYWFIL